MAALAKDRNTVRKEGDYASYQVKAAAKIFAGSIVCVGADGYAVPGADTAGLKFVGIARSYVDNTDGASGAVSIEVWRRGCFELATAQDMTAQVGTLMYIVDDQTVDLVGVTINDIAVGIISEVNSAASSYVDIGRRA